jgi:hypothetical protein
MADKEFLPSGKVLGKSLDELRQEGAVAGFRFGNSGLEGYPLSPGLMESSTWREIAKKILGAQSVTGKILSLKDLRERRCDKLFRISQPL